MSSTLKKLDQDNAALRMRSEKTSQGMADMAEQQRGQNEVRASLNTSTLLMSPPSLSLFLSLSFFLSLSLSLTHSLFFSSF